MQREIDFYSLCRSGHHAVIFWMINNVGGFDETSKDHFFVNRSTGLFYYNNVRLWTRKRLRAIYGEDFDYPSEYAWLIRNFEDVVCDVQPRNFLIVRDFLNLLSSRYKIWNARLGYFPGASITDIRVLIDVWKQHTRVSKTHPANFISYNEWVGSKPYRDALAERLGCTNAVDNVEYVPTMAEGSSFVGKRREHDVTAYNQRYKQVTLPEPFIEAAIADRELLDLNLEVFDIDVAQALTGSG